MNDKEITENNLTPKQQVFFNSYMTQGNASVAYRKAYNCTNAKDTTINRSAFLLLRNPKIQPLIHAFKAKNAKKCEISAEYVLNNIKMIGERCMQKVKIIDKDGNPTGEWKCDAQGALKAQEMLGRYLKLFEANTIVVEKHLHLTKIDINEINTGKQIQDFTRQLSQKS